MYSLAMRSAFLACVIVLGCGGGAVAPVDSGTPEPATADSGAESGDPDPGVHAGACPLEGWCWVSPLPQGNDLLDVWSDDPSDVWAVGGAGTIVHWDGTRWSLAESGTTAFLSSVWGTGPSDVWAAGGAGTIVHWDGVRWTATPSGTRVDISRLWGSGSDDVWAVGQTYSADVATMGVDTITHTAGLVLHWDGHSWSAVSVPTTAYLADLWGTGPNDVWAVGNDADSWVVLRWDGHQWSELARLDGGLPISGIWGSGPDDVRVYGDLIMYHFDGHAWAKENLGTIASVTRLGGTGKSDVWAIGNAIGPDFANIAHFDGTTWDTSSSISTMQLFGVSVRNQNDAWIVGQEGRMLRWDGHAWSDAATGPTVGDPATRPALTSVWGSGPGDVWAVGTNGGILHWDGSAWSRSTSGTTTTLRGVWGSGASDVWVIGSEFGRVELLHWDGAAWTNARTDSDPVGLSIVTSIWGGGPDDVWVVGRTKYGQHRVIYHWDGAAWSLDIAGKESLSWVWGSGPRDVWASGSSGTLLHWDGVTWSPGPIGATKSWLGPIWGSGPNDVWLGGQSTDASGVPHEELRHWDGSAWSVVEADTNTLLYAFWGSRADDVWALGPSGYDAAIVHWNGAAWARVPARASGVYGQLGALWGSGPDDVWALGGVDILHHGPP